MPELPEIASRARELNAAICGKTIESIHIHQAKCLNVPEEAFEKSLVGAVILQVGYHGKWIQVHTSTGWLLLNLGMGGEILLVTRGDSPGKHTTIFDFCDGARLLVSFWWFGYIHFVTEDGLPTHKMTAKLGPNVLDVPLAEFNRIIHGQKGAVKAFLLDQSKLAGIGNAYIHDILYLAHLHPLRRMNSLTQPETERLYQAIQDGLRPSLSKNGAFYEKDIFGNPGGFTEREILIGYRENQPCPNCSTPIVKIKTGSTSSFICPKDQPLEGG